MYQFRTVTDRIARMRKRYRDTNFTLDAERTMIATEFHKTNKSLPAPLFKAQLQLEVCSRMTVRVEDDELIVAFLDMVENHKMIVENSGLLTVAALKHLGVKDKRVVSILSGGNMDVITMSSVVQQGLIFRDRIFTVSVLLPDKPGELAKVSQTLADVQGNVIKLEHNQFVTTNRSAAVELRITLECFGTEHKEQIIAALEKKGYKPRIVRTMI